MACGCIGTIAFLRQLGCAHAARMHEARAAAHSANWTADDWRAHIAEEDQRLFPLLACCFPREVATLRAHHRTFVAELATFGRIVSTTLLEAHSALEDALVQELRRAHGLAA